MLSISCQLLMLKRILGNGHTHTDSCDYATGTKRNPPDQSSHGDETTGWRRGFYTGVPTAKTRQCDVSTVQGFFLTPSATSPRERARWYGMRGTGAGVPASSETLY